MRNSTSVSDHVTAVSYQVSSIGASIT